MDQSISVITGDVVGSQSLGVDVGSFLQSSLDSLYIHSNHYQIYRGDGFQVRIEPAEGFITMLKLRAAFLEIGSDVRMGLGVSSGETDSSMELSQGRAFVLSGKAFDSLQKNGWSIAVENASIERAFNLMLSLADLLVTSYKPATARWLGVQLNSLESTQQVLAEENQIAQSTISEALKRAGYQELMGVDQYFRDLVEEL